MDTTIGTVLRLEVKVRLLINQSEFEEAAVLCEAIVAGPKYDPRYGPALVLLAQVKLAQGKTSEACQYANTAYKWLEQRDQAGWTKKCQQVLENCQPKTSKTASNYAYAS